jgi:hypothetical protein
LCGREPRHFLALVALLHAAVMIRIARHGL